MALFKAELRAAGLELDVPQLDALVAVLISELFSCAEDLIGAPPMSSLVAINALGAEVVASLQQVFHVASGHECKFCVCAAGGRSCEPHKKAKALDLCKH